MRLKKPLLAQLLLLISLLGAFEAGMHYRSLYIREVAEVCTLILFIWLGFTTRVEKRRTWVAYLPPLGLASIMLLYALVFSLRTGASLLPSVLAQREYIFFLLAPVIYMLYARGWRLADFQRLFVLAAILTVASYALAYMTIDAELWSHSADFYKRNMTTYDDLRGYRLRGPLFIVLFVVLYFGRRAWQARNPFSFGFRSLLALPPLALVIITTPRFTVASVVLAVILYGLFLARTERFSLGLVLLPMLIALTTLAVPSLTNTFNSLFGNDPSFLTRADSARGAWNFLLEHPFFGFGQASYYSQSFQSFLGPEFHASDLGLLGVAFQFGMLGALIYLFFSLWVFVNLLRLVWAYGSANPEPAQAAFLWALFIVCFAFIIATPLQTKFIFEEGVPIGAFCWGLLLVHRHAGLLSGVPGEPGRYTGAATTATG